MRLKVREVDGQKVNYLRFIDAINEDCICEVSHREGLPYIVLELQDGESAAIGIDLDSAKVLSTLLMRFAADGTIAEVPTQTEE